MTVISFYHLLRKPLGQALPKLLEKTLAAGKRAVVLVASEERAEALSNDLWTHDPAAWLPHGTVKDGRPESQPIWLTTADETPNNATFLFQADGAESAHVADFERCFDLFDGNDDKAVAAARVRWAAYRDAGHDLTYWQQTESGGWEKKA